MPLKKSGIQVALISVILVLSMAGVIILQLNMIKSVNKASEDTVISLLSDNANQVKTVLDNQLTNVWARMSTVNAALSVIDDLTEKEAQEFLYGILPRAYNVQLVTDDGAYLDQFGKKGYVEIDDTAFRLLIYNEEVCTLRQNGEQDTVMFGIPVSPTDVDGTIYTHVMAYYDLSGLMDILAVESFAGNGKIRILNNDGYVIMRSDNVEQASYYFFKIYEKSEFIDNGLYSDYEGFKQSVMSGENHAVHLKVDGDTDKERVISYAKTEQMDWRVIIVCDYNEVLGGLENEIADIGVNSIIATVVIVLLSIIFVSFIGANLAKIRQEKQQLEKLNASLERAKKVAEDALEIAENANKSKSYFLSNMSHDIRTPMNAIMGFTTLLGKYAGNPDKVIEYTEKITASSRHLLGLINDVLDMSKIESGKTTLNLSEEAIGDIISDIDAIIRPQVNAKNHNFNINVNNINHEKIIVDKVRLNQILVNLLSNAVKYTADGGNIELNITELRSARGIVWYEFIVKDNGYGMSEEFVQKIFDSFAREEDSRTSRIQGTGLGMAITKQLVDLMGGSIQVESTKGVGSVFTVLLQFQIGKSSEAEELQKRGITEFLVIDSEEEIRRSVADAMKNSGVNIDYALSAEQAIKSVQGNSDYQLVILHWKTPEADVKEALSGIRQKLPQNIPVLLLTDFTLSESEEANMLNYVDGILSKPFFASNIKRKVVEITARRSGKKSEEKAVESVFKGRRILAAEDNELNSEILREILVTSGAKCDICENGKLTVEKFLSSPEGYYDLIFMDIQMPIMNGYEATKLIRMSGHPDAGKIPIIAMTANAFTEDIQNAIKSGMNAHISKPVNIEIMEKTVAQELNKK